MIKIVICEDQQEYIHKIKSIISREINFDIVFFNKGEEILEELDKKVFLADIYILDIELPGINGLDLAHKIRQKDINSIIIFLSNHDKYVFDSFEVNPFRYIRKYEMDITLLPALQAAESQLGKYSHISIKTKDFGIMRIELSNIVSVEKNGKQIEFRLKDGRFIKDNRTLKELLCEINNDSFIMIKKGIIINVSNIISFNGDKLTMIDNSVQYVSRNYIKLVKLAIAKAWR